MRVCVCKIPSSIAVPALQGKKNISLNPHLGWNEETETAKQDARLAADLPDSSTTCTYWNDLGKKRRRKIKLKSQSLKFIGIYWQESEATNAKLKKCFFLVLLVNNKHLNLNKGEGRVFCCLHYGSRLWTYISTTVYIVDCHLLHQHYEWTLMEYVFIKIVCSNYKQVFYVRLSRIATLQIIYAYNLTYQKKIYIFDISYIWCPQYVFVL